MMLLQNAHCIVKIEVKSTVPIDEFEIVCNPNGIDIDDYYSARTVRVEMADGALLRIALIDLVTSSYEPCAVLEDYVLTVIMFSTILQIDLKTGAVMRCVDCDNMGGLFEIHPIHGGYIIWGEGEVFRYDRELKQIWLRTGSDILVDPDGEKSFWIENDRIHCRDWEGWHHVWDLDGRIISMIKEKSPDS